MSLTSVTCHCNEHPCVCRKQAQGHEHEHAHVHKHAHAQRHSHTHTASEHSCACGHVHETAGPEQDQLHKLRWALALLFFLLAYALKQPWFYLGSWLLVLPTCLKSWWLNRRQPFNELSLMLLASLGAIVLGEWPEAALILFLYDLGEFLESRASHHAQQEVQALSALQPEHAWRIEQGQRRLVPAASLQIGDQIVIPQGERVPVDVVVREGQSRVDASALTGESAAQSVRSGQELLSGCLNLESALSAEVLRSEENSAAKKLLNLSQNIQNKEGQRERWLRRLSQIYTPAVFALALLVATVPSLFAWLPLEESLRRALVILVASCPCALVLSIPLTFAISLGRASHLGALFQGSLALENLAAVKSAAFDKTGTLSTGQMRVLSHDLDARSCAVVASVEAYSNHPLAPALMKLSSERVRVHDVREYSGLGIRALVDGQELRIGRPDFLRALGCPLPEQLDAPIAVGTALEFWGSLEVSDEMRETAPACLQGLRALGLSPLVLLSGDRQDKVQRFAEKLPLDAHYAELMPEDKLALLPAQCLYIGDGLNDAPSLKKAQVGMTLGQLGSGLAAKTADILLVHEQLAVIPELIRLARNCLCRVKENSIFALGSKFLVLLLGILGLAPLWLGVVADVGVTLLVVLNSFRK